MCLDDAANPLSKIVHRERIVLIEEPRRPLERTTHVKVRRYETARKQVGVASK
jgi:hypothetical protein